MTEKMNKIWSPLELKSKNKFGLKGFIAYPFTWIDVDVGGKPKTSRDLDLFARKSIDVSDDILNIKVQVEVFASCKSRENYLFFLFDKSHPEVIQKFPIVFASDPLVDYFSVKDVSELNFPICVDHSIQAFNVVSSDPSTKPVDQEVNKATEEVLDFMEDRFRNYENKNRIGQSLLEMQIPYEIISNISEKFGKNGELSNIKSALYKMSQSSRKDILDILSKNKLFLNIEICFPMVITEGKIAKVVLDPENKPTDYENIGYGIYLHRPRDLQKRTIYSPVPLIPILFTDYDHLDKCIDSLMKVAEDVKQQIHRNIQSRNHERVVDKILSIFSKRYTS
ncbi:MAG: hypothetical protein HY512_02235 [Candidatus Aenigmarchaeota archaeon]|nr:hypothetical protein [Candidatus Aenigmarchaeota archaeon]